MNNFEWVSDFLAKLNNEISLMLTQPDFYLQLALIVAAYLVAFLVASGIRKSFAWISAKPRKSEHPLKGLLSNIDSILFPMLACLLLKFGHQGFINNDVDARVISLGLSIAVVLFYWSLIEKFVTNPVLSKLFKWIGIPILALHLAGTLPAIITVLEDIKVTAGNISVSAYGLVRVLIFGIFLFWFGRASNDFGQTIIRKQESIDIRTREVFAKLLEVALFSIVVLLMMNIMGINLTALAVLGGALGVGLGFGLQSIAASFISGIIILLDRSITVGDFVELDDGSKGFVRQFRMRYTVLETYDGKDIMVPNDKFISSTFINWSHKDPKQRYRVDFSVAYKTDIREMVEIVKKVVADHPQVISGDHLPIEIRPDCEIDSFGDSGVNMFVEFWMDGIDDGKNRVGGDLLLMIFEALKEHNIEIPFPQREVKILKD